MMMFSKVVVHMVGKIMFEGNTIRFDLLSDVIYFASSSPAM